MNYWLDAHCHMHEPWFKSEEHALIVQSALSSGVKEIINCSSDPNYYSQVIKSADFPSIWYSLGIQPTLANDYYEKDLLKLFTPLVKGKFVGLGEVGLDYYWVKDETNKKIQRILFKEIINVANELKLNLIIHSRKAESDCLDILEATSQTPVLLHSFDGNLKETNRAIDLGYKISIPTNLTIRKNRRKTAKRAGLDNIMLETDSPFCGYSEELERNEPKYIVNAGEYLASFLGVEIEEVAKSTRENALKFYKI